MLASFVAVGLDPTKSLLFCQSSVPEHAELMWILSCNASMGYLARMTQWKSKMALPDTASPFDTSSASASTSRESTKLGLFAYPVLQAADILLYGTTHVPVGEDQAQHLEFSRQLANTFNHTITPQDPIFTLPETILSPAKRVMSLKEPSKKMSKSDPDPKSRILITDETQDIRAKIKGALTDSIEGISYDPTTRPGVSNLIDLMCYMDPTISLTPHEVANDMQNVSMRSLKEKVADVVDHNLRGIRERYKSLMSKEPSYLAAINDRGASAARKIAQGRMGAIRAALGMGSLDS
ncbi:Nucleotidylyl transferase [Westerdykella ornata]|uniref:tryptophan--tRNA ligase n=1 Tax=Westerdykella ornata TaxID=318751 RepID=A0A6A6J6Y6_WESOR|nr:Nucleotidylyl transferase [Westerdykella ornata]KAF2272330.1 Nucleotidylyl transferase [Westerdykella ornata]